MTFNHSDTTAPGRPSRSPGGDGLTPPAGLDRMRAVVRSISALSLLLATLGGAAPARAQPADYFQQGGTGNLTFTVDRERCTRQRVLIASLFGSSVLFGGVGLLFHIDSRNKSDEVSTNAGRHSGRIYTDELDDTRSAAIRSRNLAIASYAVGGGFLVGTLVAYLLTDPGHETVQVGTEAVGGGGAGARLLVEPTEGGALVGGDWRF